MSSDIDLAFRPKSYFGAEKLEKYLLSKVKGAVLRRKLQAMFAQGRHAEVRELAQDLAFSATDRRALEAFHPMYMGGNYLHGRTEAITQEPMTLGEFADFFLEAWPLIDVLEMNFEDDLEGALGFFTADSSFYPEFDALCREWVWGAFEGGDACR